MNPYRTTDAAVVEAHGLCNEPIGDPTFLPSIEAFTAALNAACVLSTTMLEGRALPGAVVLIARGTQPSGFIVRIADATPDGLRTLVAGAGNGQVVVRDDGQGSFEVLGIEFEGYAKSIGIRFQFRTFGRVFIVAADSLVAGEVPAHGLVAAEFSPTARDEFRPALALGSFLTAERLLELLTAISAGGSGGTLVVDPSGTEWGSHLAGPLSPWDYSTRSAKMQEQAAKLAYVATMPKARRPVSDADRRELRDRGVARLSSCLRSFGAMSRADGAIVLRPNLALAGFAVRLEGKEPKTVIVRSLLGPPGAPPFTTSPPGPLGGTRLQGAIAFAKRRRDTVSFVVSADGPVTMVWFEVDRVHLSRGLEAFL